VRNLYGITELANWVAGGSARDRDPEDGLIGPMWGGSVKVRRSDGSLAATGEGEIVVRSPSLMSGYFRRPELTREVVHDSWYFTGDSGAVDADGCIRISGRIKSEINRGGMKVSPEDVDLLLEGHPAVAEACAFGLQDPIAGETVAVAVHLEPGYKAESEELRSWCMERIRRECVPERWFFLDPIPKTVRGKINRDNVRAACLEEKAT
jgi:acyl-CoA synthetase (AMP-forming)/AMP-acid ligase II